MQNKQQIFKPSATKGYSQKQVVDLIFAAAKTISRDINMRLDLIENKGVKYWGVFAPGTNYAEGAIVTHKSTIWHCKVPSTTGEPGKSGDWQLMVKSVNTRGSRA